MALIPTLLFPGVVELVRMDRRKMLWAMMVSKPAAVSPNIGYDQQKLNRIYSVLNVKTS